MAGPAASTKYKKCIEPFKTSMKAIHGLLAKAQEDLPKYQCDLREAPGKERGGEAPVPKGDRSTPPLILTNTALHCRKMAVTFQPIVQF